VRLVRLGLVANFSNQIIDDGNVPNENAFIVTYLPFWTYLSLLGLLSFLTTFMYTERWSRPTYFLHSVMLAVCICADFLCLGFAAKGVDWGVPPFGSTIGSTGQALAAFSIIGCCISVIQAFIHVWSSPMVPNPTGCESFQCGSMKISGQQQQIHLGINIPNLVIRVIRFALAADVLQKASTGGFRANSVSFAHVLYWTFWGVLGMAIAAAAHAHAYYFTKSTYNLMYFMILFAFAFDFGAAGFAVSQWIGGVAGPSGDVSEAQAIAALGFIQAVFMLIWLIVFLTKYEVPSDDDENENGGAAAANTTTTTNEAIPLG